MICTVASSSSTCCPAVRARSVRPEGRCGDVGLSTPTVLLASPRLSSLKNSRVGFNCPRLPARRFCNKSLFPSGAGSGGSTLNCPLSSGRISSWGVRGLCNASLACDSSNAGFGQEQGEERRELLPRISNAWHTTHFVRKIVALGVVLVLCLPRSRAWACEGLVLSPERKGLVASAWAGLVAGCLHTLTGPDHLAGLAPLCIGCSRLRSVAVGALWGCGHDTGQILFGLTFLLLKERLHIEFIRTWASRVVGLTLIGIGGVGIYESEEKAREVAFAEEAASQGAGEQKVGSGNDSKLVTTFATGVVYGLQPDALFVILPALAFPSRVSGAAFLGMFLFGTVLAMGSYALFLSSSSEALKKWVPDITKNLAVGSSLIAIALGIGLIGSELFGFSLL